MLISYNWLRELIATDLSPNDLRERLTMVGLAIDAVEEHANDFVLDVEVPSNRPDCLSHVGIAREVAVIEGGEVRQPAQKPITGKGKASSLTSVEIEDAALCPRYAARIVRGVTIGPSPDWLVHILETIGQRSINNVADVTNYVLHELGQPLHAFDLEKLSDHRIVVRPARSGETLKTLDGIERKLTPDMLVIADADQPVALAGIMGGEESEISDRTKDVLIESAYFNPDSVRRTARTLGMDTEASRRFERGADRENVLRAQERCVELICELAGGVATEDAIDVYPQPVPPRLIRFRLGRLKELTSLSVDPAEMNRILTGLGFISSDETSAAVSFTVPSWRVDVEQEVDLVEEVARHSGYDRIPSELPPFEASGEYQPQEIKLRLLRRSLNALSFDEAINFSFTQRQTSFELIPEFTGSEITQAELMNPIIEDAGWMRLTLISGLLSSLRHNLNQGNRDVRLFEIGRVFAVKIKGELPLERLALGMVASGGIVQESLAESLRDFDFFDLKGALEAGIASMNLPPLVFAEKKINHLRIGQAAEIRTSDNISIGTIGRLADDVSASYKFRQPIYVMELDLTTLLSTPGQLVQYTPLPRYPSVVRDLSLMVSRDVSFADIVDSVKRQAVADCRNVMLVGTYEGVNIPSGQRSITLRIEYRADERTLRDEEVEARHAELTSVLLQSFAAKQR